MCPQQAPQGYDIGGVGVVDVIVRIVTCIRTSMAEGGDVHGGARHVLCSDMTFS